MHHRLFPAIKDTEAFGSIVPVPMAELLGLAHELERSGKLPEADRLLNYVLAAAPRHSDALHLSGIVAFRMGRHEDALAKVEAAIAGSVDSALYLRNICEIYRVLSRLDDAVAAARRAVALAPGDPLCLHNLAVIHFEREEIGESLACAEMALLMEPEMANSHLARAEALLIQGRLQEGWEEYEWRFRVPFANPPIPSPTRPQWDGRPFSDGILLLVADQGFGDVIQFCRYIPWVAALCPDLAVACSPEMVPVLEQLLPKNKIFHRWEATPPFKAYCPLSGLPRLHGTRIDTIPVSVPYLQAEPLSVVRWEERLTSLIPSFYRRVGIVWAGRPTHSNDRRRSARLADFAPLARVPGVAFVSLQKGRTADQAGSYFGRAPLINISTEIANFSDTMAILEGLDLVVSVDTSVAHLAAAMGKRTWILLPTAPDWRWLLERYDSPWYPSAHLFRQAEAGNWDGVMSNVAATLISVDWCATR